MVLTDRHRRVIELVWSGYSRKAIAEKLGISKHTIDWYYEKKEFVDALHSYQEVLPAQVRESVSGLTITALRVAAEMMLSPNENTRRHGAELILSKVPQLKLIEEKPLVPEVKKELTTEERLDRMAELIEKLDRVLNDPTPLTEQEQKEIEALSSSRPVEESMANLHFSHSGRCRSPD